MPEKKLEELFEEFLYECDNVARLRPETLKGYRAAFDLLMKVGENSTLTTIQEPKFMTNFFANLRTRPRKVGKDTFTSGIKESTSATYHAKLKKFFRWLKARDYIKENPFDKMVAPNVEYLDRKFLKKEDVHKLFHACNLVIRWENDFVRRRNLAMLAALLYCGLRRGELLGLELRDVDLERRVLTVRGETSKSKHMRRIPLNVEVMRTFEDYLRARGAQGVNTSALWASSTEHSGLTRDGLKHLVTKLNRESGVKFHIHQLRHTFAVNLLAQSVDVAKIQQLMGHKDIRMTAKYVRCFPADEMRNDVASLNFDQLI